MTDQLFCTVSDFVIVWKCDSIMLVLGLLAELFFFFFNCSWRFWIIILLTMLTTVKIYMTAIKASSKFDKATGFSVNHLLIPERWCSCSPWRKKILWKCNCLKYINYLISFLKKKKKIAFSCVTSKYCTKWCKNIFIENTECST